MSRHEVVDEQGAWVFGWDPPLQSFFLQRYVFNTEDEAPGIWSGPAIWLGADKETHMPKVSDLMVAAEKHGFDLKPPMRKLCFNDKKDGV